MAGALTLQQKRSGKMITIRNVLYVGMYILKQQNMGDRRSQQNKNLSHIRTSYGVSNKNSNKGDKRSKKKKKRRTSLQRSIQNHMLQIYSAVERHTDPRRGSFHLSLGQRGWKTSVEWNEGWRQRNEGETWPENKQQKEEASTAANVFHRLASCYIPEEEILPTNNLA